MKAHRQTSSTIIIVVGFDAELEVERQKALHSCFGSNDHLGSCLDKAHHLWNQDRACRIVVCGGRGNKILPMDEPLSARMKRSLVSKFRIPEHLVLEESWSRNTMEAVAFSKYLLDQKREEIVQGYIVAPRCHDFHLELATKCFKYFFRHASLKTISHHEIVQNEGRNSCCFEDEALLRSFSTMLKDFSLPWRPSPHLLADRSLETILVEQLDSNDFALSSRCFESQERIRVRQVSLTFAMLKEYLEAPSPDGQTWWEIIGPDKHTHEPISPLDGEFVKDYLMKRPPWRFLLKRVFALPVSKRTVEATTRQRSIVLSGRKGVSLQQGFGQQGFEQQVFGQQAASPFHLGNGIMFETTPFKGEFDPIHLGDKKKSFESPEAASKKLKNQSVESHESGQTGSIAHQIARRVVKRFFLKKSTGLKSPVDVKVLLEAALCGLKTSGPVADVRSPVKVLGNFSGNLQNMLAVFDCFGSPSRDQGDIETTTYVFSVTFVDRDEESEHKNIEELVLLLSILILYPSRVVLLRGRMKISGRRDDNLKSLLRKLFGYLPVACVIDHDVAVIRPNFLASGLQLRDLRVLSLPFEKKMSKSLNLDMIESLGTSFCQQSQVRMIVLCDPDSAGYDLLANGRVLSSFKRGTNDGGSASISLFMFSQEDHNNLKCFIKKVKISQG